MLRMTGLTFLDIIIDRESMFRPAVMHIVGLHSLALEILEGL